MYYELRQKILPQLIELRYTVKQDKTIFNIRLFRVAIPALNQCYFTSTLNDSILPRSFRSSCFKIKGMDIVDSMEYYDSRNIKRGEHIYEKDVQFKTMRTLTLKEIYNFAKTKTLSI